MHVLWSASESGGRGGIHDFKVLPYPLKVKSALEHWPDEIQRFWLQAVSSLQNENWDAAALMARSALQVALRDKGAFGKNLKQEIDNLAKKGILPPIMKDWSNEVRLLGNISAHPQPGEEETSPEDANDIVEFLNFLLNYLYDLPKQINDYRKRKEKIT